MNNALLKNFKTPAGLIGAFVGSYMSFDNFQLNRWAVHNLDVQDNDRILEIGFGPGIAIQEILKRSKNACIGGVDCSELMIHQAKKRNRKFVTNKQVDLKSGNANNLPQFDMEFDKILSVNNIMYWDKPVEALQELRKNLKEGGSITVVFQRCCEACLRQGFHNNEINGYISYLQQAGFVNIKAQAHNIFKHRNSTNLNYQQCHYSQSVVGGICIVGFNPSLEMMIEENITKPKAYQLSKRLYVDYLACGS